MLRKPNAKDVSACILRLIKAGKLFVSTSEQIEIAAGENIGNNKMVDTTRGYVAREIPNVYFTPWTEGGRGDLIGFGCADSSDLKTLKNVFFQKGAVKPMPGKVSVFYGKLDGQGEYEYIYATKPFADVLENIASKGDVEWDGYGDAKKNTTADVSVEAKASKPKANGELSPEAMWKFLTDKCPNGLVTRGTETAISKCESALLGIDALGNEIGLNGQAEKAWLYAKETSRTARKFGGTWEVYFEIIRRLDLEKNYAAGVAKKEIEATLAKYKEQRDALVELKLSGQLKVLHAERDEAVRLAEQAVADVKTDFLLREGKLIAADTEIAAIISLMDLTRARLEELKKPVEADAAEEKAKAEAEAKEKADADLKAEAARLEALEKELASLKLTDFGKTPKNERSEIKRRISELEKEIGK